MYYVYILLCKENSLYTGISTNPRQRFEDHKSGKGGKYTRSHKPLKIVYQEKHPTKSSALKRELEIKNWPKSAKITLINKPG